MAELSPPTNNNLPPSEVAFTASPDEEKGNFLVSTVPGIEAPHVPQSRDDSIDQYLAPANGTRPDATAGALSRYLSRWLPTMLSWKARFTYSKGAVCAVWKHSYSRFKSNGALVILFWFSGLFCCLYCIFIYAVLIKAHVELPGGRLWDAVTTNLVVGVLSQFSAILTAATLKALMGALKRAFLYRERGMKFSSWVGLGGSEWWSVFQVALVSGGLDFWCDIRLLLPVMSLAFGSIVKFDADFVDYFQPCNVSMPVYAGLIPPETVVIDQIPAADITMYFSTWSASLLTNTMFSTDLDFPLEDFTCARDCRAQIMPGGLAIARQYKNHLNESVFFGDVFGGNMDAIRIENATAMIVKFDTPEPSSLVFDTAECVYTGQQVKNGLQVCVRQIGNSILVAWSACPKSRYDSGSCNSNPAWRSAPPTSSTLMSLYSLQTKTSYSISSQRIITIQPISKSPNPIALSAPEYTKILTKILVPPSSAAGGSSASPTQLRDFDRDTHNINSLIDAITWMHRTFLKSFPSDRNSPTSYLQNLLSVPVQFSMTARTYANYSAVERGIQDVVQFPLNETMRTVARGGRSRQRLKIQTWAGAVFIAADLGVHLAMGFGILWILFLCEGSRDEPGRDSVLPDENGIKELEDVREAERVAVEGVAVGVVEEKGKWKAFVRWVGWMVRGRWRTGPGKERARSPNGGEHGMIPGGGDELITVPLLRFARGDDSKVADEAADDSPLKMAWKYRTVRMVGRKPSAPR